MSRAPELRRKKLKKIPGHLYSTKTKHNFGDDSFASVQLLSMIKPGLNIEILYTGGPVSVLVLLPGSPSRDSLSLYPYWFTYLYF